MRYAAIMEAKGLFRGFANKIDEGPNVQEKPKLAQIIQPDFCIGEAVRSTPSTGRRRETQTENTTAPRRARLAQSRSACSSSGLSGRSSSAFTAKPLRTRGQRSVRWPRSGPRTVGGVWDRPLRSNAVLKHTLTRLLGIAAVRANARMRLRVLSLVTVGGKSVPVGSAAGKNKHFEEAERENYRRHGPLVGTCDFRCAWQ
jgi:hypothetical protein